MSDIEPGDRVAVVCPSCSPSVETVHEVLSTGGGRATIRCSDCEHVHKEQLPDETTLDREVVVSQDDESFTATAAVPEDEQLSVGEEFLLETEEAIVTARITSLELADERVEEAPATDVETIWTRAVGNVQVNVTLHPKEGAGSHDDTRSVKIGVPGDFEFSIGETAEVGGEEFTVEGVHVREDAHGYDHDKLDHPGDTVAAKDVGRVYARDESTTAWSVW
jgi:uncharacterized Zn finger protein